MWEWICRRQTVRGLQLVSCTRDVWADMQGPLFSDLVARSMGRSWGHSCELLPYHHLLLVFWPLTHLCLFSPLPLFLSCLSYVLLGVSGPAAILVCLSGMNGSTLWSSPLPEEARDITCLNLMPGAVAETICLVTGTHKMLSAFNATSGKDRFPGRKDLRSREP